MSTGRAITEATVKRLVGERVKGRCGDLGMTQAECASRAEVPEQLLAEFEGGGGEPDAFAVSRIAAVLGCDTDDLMSGVRWVVTPREEGGGHWEVD